VDERLKFVARLLDGEKMAVLCYKILTRYNEIGLEGLTDRSRRPYRHANQLPLQIETRIVRLLKHLLRKAAARDVEALNAAIGALLQAFTPQECANYFENAGYAPS
jgi:hypothetical protein